MSSASEDELPQEGSERESVPDLAASATESDSNDEDDDNSKTSKDVSDGDNEEKTDKKSPHETREKRVTENILQRYQGRQGKQLFVRFPHKLPSDKHEFLKKAKSLSPLVVNAHKPRQKHARFCLVDFSSKKDRDTALKSIQASIKTNPSLGGLVASIPYTESDEFLKELAERKLKSVESKIAQKRLKRASKKALRDKNLTSSIVILNLPKNTSVGDVRKLFPNAVDVQIKVGRGKAADASIASITMPSTLDATAAVKQKVSIGDTELLIRFDTHNMKKKKSSGKKRRLEIKGDQSELTPSPMLPTKKAKKVDSEDKLLLDIKKDPAVSNVKGKNVKDEKLRGDDKTSSAHSSTKAAKEKKLKDKTTIVDSLQSTSPKKAKREGEKDSPVVPAEEQTSVNKSNIPKKTTVE